MEAIDRMDVCVRERISMYRVGAGSMGSLNSRWNQSLVKAERWSPQCERKS